MNLRNWVLAVFLVFACGYGEKALAVQPSLVRRGPAMGDMGIQCRALLGQSNSIGKPSVPTLAQLQEQLDGNRKPLPGFYDMSADLVALSNWRDGAAAPKVLRSLLPKNVEYLPAPILQPNEPGVIKQSSGGFVPLRVSVEIRGRKEYTNVGIPADALFRNQAVPQDQKVLIPPDAKAIIVYRHGGGTIGTGHHVATQLAAFFRPYGVYVVGYDHANHAMGPRALKNESGHTSAKADVEFGYEFIRQHLAPSGVPIFLSGHSMGGVYSIAEMVMFDEVFRDPKVAALIKGFIPLSPVLDGTPYSDPNHGLDFGSNGTDLAPSEVGLFKAFTLSGKLQPLCDMGCSPLTYSLNLQSIIDSRKPGSGPAANIPAMIIVGTGDFLYAPFKEAWTALESAPNIEVYKMDQRASLLSKSLSDREIVGHLLMDYMAPIRVNDQKISGTRNNKEVSRIVDALTLGYAFSGNDVLTLYKENIIPLELVNALIRKSGYYEEEKKPIRAEKTKRTLAEIISQIIPRSKPEAVGEWRKMIFAFLKNAGMIKVSPFVSDLGEVRTPEPFLVIKDFLERSIKVSLKKEAADSGSIMSLILTEWMRNLAFRAFVENFSGVRKMKSTVTTNMTPLGKASGNLLSAVTKGINFGVIKRVHESLRNTSQGQIIPAKADLNATIESFRKFSGFLNEFKKAYLSWKFMDGSQSQIFGFSVSDGKMLEIVEKLDKALLAGQRQIGGVLDETAKDKPSILDLVRTLDLVFQYKDQLSPILSEMGVSISQLYKASYLPESISHEAGSFTALIAEQDRLGIQNREIRRNNGQLILKQNKMKTQLKKIEHELRVGMNSVGNRQLTAEISQLTKMENKYYEFAEKMNKDIKLYLGAHHLGRGEFDVDVYSNLPPALKSDFHRYQDLLVAVRGQEKRVSDLYSQLLLSGVVAFNVGVEGKGSVSAKELMINAQSIKGELEGLVRDINSAETEFAKNFQRISELDLEKSRILGEDSYLTYQTLSLMPILNGGPHSEAIAQEVWSYWTENIWGNRIPESSTSYY